MARSTSTRPPAAITYPWIHVAPNTPYFVTEHGQPWTPIGHNDAITWPHLAGLFRRRDHAAATAYLHMLAQHGVTCLRLMLEYCQTEHRYLERPVGHFQPHMVRLWDDLFALCAETGMRLLLTPYDTFWMWKRWDKHPYHSANGGLCARQRQWLLNQDMRAAIKQRLAFATERWGGTGLVFAWDMWNEIHPAHAEDSADVFADFVADISDFLHATELRLHGRTHLQTVSVFGPTLAADPQVGACVFRHPALDFATSHCYANDTIDNPRNTVDAARSMAELTRQALAEITDQRPFFDSEHGPIHAFKDRRRTLSEAFDDEYFRHMQWAHVASGGAGGGMRWPNRHPHTLTPGMHAAQRALAAFLPLIDWPRFQRRNWNADLVADDPGLAVFGCGDDAQAVVWAVRINSLGPNGMVQPAPDAPATCMHLPVLPVGEYAVTTWDTLRGTVMQRTVVPHTETGRLRVPLPPVASDCAIAITRLNA